MITQYLAKKFVPPGSPVFHKMNDSDDFITILSWLGSEMGLPEKVYKTAYRDRSHLDRQLLYLGSQILHEWFIASENPKLPMILFVQSLKRAIKIHERPQVIWKH